MSQELERCAATIRNCWMECDAALGQGDAEGANDAFGRAFEAVDNFPAVEDHDVRAMRFLCILTWVKVAASLEINGQQEEANEARQQVFRLVDELLGPEQSGLGQAWASLDFVEGLESEEVADLVGRLYLLCGEAKRGDTLLWGRCFMDIDLKVHGNHPPAVN